jgi:myo-inositol-1(or 4)-monophosphatase
VIAREAGAIVVDLDGSPHTTASGATIATAAPLRHALMQIVDAAVASTRQEKEQPTC